MTSRLFNADEVFEMAEQIERNGEKFYRLAAESVEQADMRQMLSDLAVMEGKHEQVFGEMRKDLSKKEREETVFDPDGEAALYLRALADKRVFDTDKDPDNCFTGKESVQEVLKMALVREKDSIVFYVGMMDFIPKEFGRNKINDLIREEMKHITLLSKKMISLGI